jgi:hypothetical protein
VSAALQHTLDGASLFLRPVGDITGQFFVDKYQRGYRWTSHEVTCLLDDIWANGEKPYCLQPVVVKRRGEQEWELVDGQQRLTTLFLVFRYLQRNHLPSAGPQYSIRYATRPDSEGYLDSLEPALHETNIDFYHLHGAYECIRHWFENHERKVSHLASKFLICLHEHVQVIWYEAPPVLDSTTLFTRLNVGRIPLTDAELLKALLLSKSRVGIGNTARAHELAAQWDSFERDLQRPDVWAFVTTDRPEDCPTRITLLLDALAGGPRGRERRLFYTFDKLREDIENDGPQAVWNRVVDLHAQVMGWFEDRSVYHKIGYLVAVGERFDKLVVVARDRTKSAFEAELDRRIRKSLDLSRSGVEELSYETATKRDKCSRLLLLMNVETVRRLEDSSERYSFVSHAAKNWTLEHIHAQNAEELTKKEQWEAWLDLHHDAIKTLPAATSDGRDELLAKIDAVRGVVDRRRFQEVVRDVTALFTRNEGSGRSSVHSVHSISNLALLSGGANSALKNAVFEVKRKRVLQLDRRGEYIPIATRRVFLKYYTDAQAQQIHFWSTQDRQRYLEALLDTVADYLKDEEVES